MKKTIKNTLILCSLCGNPVSLSAAGQLADVPLEDLMELSLSSITRMDTKLHNSPVSAYVVTQQDINKKGYRYLIDILKNTPGIYIVENSLVEKAGTEIYVRGILSNSKMLVLVNGHRIKPASGEPMSFFSSMPLLNLKQVEISLGSGASLYGADAMTATINLVTFNGADIEGLRSKVTVGNRDTAEVQFLAGKSVTDSVGIALSGSFQHTQGENFARHDPDSYSNAVLGPPDMEENNYSVHFKANIDKLTLSYYRVETKRNSGLGLDILENDDPFTLFYDVSGESFLQISNQLASADYEWDINPFWQMKTQLAYENTYLDPDSQYKFDVGKGITTRHVTWNSSSTRLTQNIAYQKGPLHWIGGAEFMHISASPKKDIEEPLGEYHSSYENYAVFTQMQYDILSNLTITAGLRLDIDSRYDEEINPRIGFSWQANKNLRLFGSWGTSYLSPSPYLIYERFNKPSDGFYKRPNESLNSEHLTSYELGGEWKLNAFHQFRLVGFYYEASDLVRQIKVSPDGLRINENNDKHQIYGLEASARNKLLENLSLDIAYTMTMGIKDAGNFGDGNAKLSHMPIHLMQGTLLYDYDPFVLRISGRWFDHVYSRPDNDIYNGGAANGTVIFDANLHYQYQLNSYQFNVDFNVNNIFDEKYYKLSTVDGDSFGLPRTLQDTRRFSLVLGVEF
jgi:outer membrane receptor for ferrienterochelin and colicin